MKICVFGAASAHIDKKYIELTEALCEKLAKRGHSLVFGAGNSGLMGAAARGFKKGGAYIHGVIPEFFREEAVEEIYGDCDEITYTETMSERKKIMEDEADSFIIVPGGIGTFEEFFEVLTLKQLGRHDKAMVLYDIDGYYDGMRDFLRLSAQRNFITNDCNELYACLTDDEEVIKYIEGYVSDGASWRRFKPAT